MCQGKSIDITIVLIDRIVFFFKGLYLVGIKQDVI